MVAMTKGTESTSCDGSFMRRESPPGWDLTLLQSVDADSPIRHRRIVPVPAVRQLVAVLAVRAVTPATAASCINEPLECSWC
jgi:hypothetical protein